MRMNTSAHRVLDGLSGHLVKGKKAASCRFWWTPATSRSSWCALFTTDFLSPFRPTSVGNAPDTMLNSVNASLIRWSSAADEQYHWTLREWRRLHRRTLTPRTVSGSIGVQTCRMEQPTCVANVKKNIKQAIWLKQVMLWNTFGGQPHSSQNACEFSVRSMVAQKKKKKTSAPANPYSTFVSPCASRRSSDGNVQLIQPRRPTFWKTKLQIPRSVVVAAAVSRMCQTRCALSRVTAMNHSPRSRAHLPRSRQPLSLAWQSGCLPSSSSLLFCDVGLKRRNHGARGLFLPACSCGTSLWFDLRLSFPSCWPPLAASLS